MKLLITGAFGFVGTNISKSFKSLKLVAIDINHQDNPSFDEYYSWNDLANVEWDKIDAIIHLAGKAHDTGNTSAEKEYSDINVGLTERIFKYFLKSAATKFIFFSSVKAAADSVNGDQLTEDVLPNPQTPYGRSKLEAERYILNELEKWKSDWTTGRLDDCTKEGKYDCTTGRLHDGTTPQPHENKKHTQCIDKKVYILRPCMIHGPGNKGNLNLLYKISQKGLPWPLGAYENRRSFCSIDNISFVIQQLIEKDIESGIYQVADDEALSTNELIKLIAISQNKKTRIWNIPARLISVVAEIGDYLPIPLNSERLKKLTESYVASNQKIKDALGIEKMPVSAKDGFRRTLDSFRK
jgi:nucleoside-diphosphate-sugar epimerase